MPTVINDSANISSLDSRIVASLCSGNFVVDVSPSVWIGSGASNVQGASVKITNPVGVVITNYPTSGFDINPPMTGNFSYPIPQIANNFQYGNYVIDVRLTDGDGDTYTISKTINICPPDPNNKNKKEGCLNVNIKGDCVTGRVIILLNQVPTYKGTLSTTQTNELTVEYPTASGLAPYETTLNNFGIVLFEGQYLVTGSVCATYLYGDNIYFEIKYKIKCEKIIRCMIDECCVFAQLEELRLKSNSDCTQVQKDETASIALNAIFLLKTAQLAASCGEDPSDIVGDLEALLGCNCTCNCNDGAPIYTPPDPVDADWLYRGILNQSETSDPTVSNSPDNLVTITWVRNDAGYFIGTITGTFTPLTADNCFVLITNAANTLTSAGYLSADSIFIRTGGDGQLQNLSIQLSIF